MPLLLTPEEHRALFETHQGPAPMLDLLGAAALRMAATAARMGVFQELADGPLPADELARRAGADPRGTRLLLDALAAHGYLRRRDDGAYENSGAAAAWMVRNGGPAFADTVEFWDDLLFRLWPSLDRSIAEGRPPTDWYAWLEENPRTLRAFQSMLAGMAAARGPEIARAAALPHGARTLLDVGGSHALYAAAFCRAYPGLSATVLDFPGAAGIGRENVRREGMEDRIVFREGNFLEGPLGEGWDAVLLCRVVHGLDGEENTRLLRRAHDALAPGGRVVVVEEYDPGTRPADTLSDAFMATFSLNMYHLQGARNYATDEIRGWLADAGFAAGGVREAVVAGDRVITAARTEGDA